jgi:polyphosphate glucokinase
MIDKGTQRMEPTQEVKALKILAIDIGGTNLKVKCSTGDEVRKVPSGRKMTAERMVAAVKEMTQDWEYDVISMGFPGPVIHGRILREPYNLGSGWVKYDLQKAFGKPIKIINDAAMQAIGSYEGGRMLLLDLGTGLGTAMIVEGVVQPLEMGHLPYKKGRTYEEYVGLRGLKRLGKKRWRKAVAEVAGELSAALEPDYVVLGGGNAKFLKELPINSRLGANANAFVGGFRMWSDDHRQQLS